MADTLIYLVNLPAVPVGMDVESGELTITVDGSSTVHELAKDATVVEDVRVPQDSLVNMELVYIDDSQNRSEPSVHEFTAVDTIAPPAPGEFGVTLVGEEDELEGSPGTDPGPSPGIDPDPVDPVDDTVDG